MSDEKHTETADGGKEFDANEKSGSGLHACAQMLDILHAALGARSLPDSGKATDDANPCRRMHIDTGRYLRHLIQAALARTPDAPDDGRTACAADALSLASALADESMACAAGHFSIAATLGTAGIACADGDHALACSIGSRAAACATGEHGVAAATGYRGMAHAGGHCGHACTAGDYGAASVAGAHAAAAALGYQGRARGAHGCALFLVYRNQDDEILHAGAAIVGQHGILPDVYYRLSETGEFMVAEEQ
jgi:hypothetical protein